MEVFNISRHLTTISLSTKPGTPGIQLTLETRPTLYDQAVINTVKLTKKHAESMIGSLEHAMEPYCGFYLGLTASKDVRPSWRMVGFFCQRFEGKHRVDPNWVDAFLHLTSFPHGRAQTRLYALRLRRREVEELSLALQQYS